MQQQQRTQSIGEATEEEPPEPQNLLMIRECESSARTVSSGLFTSHSSTAPQPHSRTAPQPPVAAASFAAVPQRSAEHPPLVRRMTNESDDSARRHLQQQQTLPKNRRASATTSPHMPAVNEEGNLPASSSYGSYGAPLATAAGDSGSAERKRVRSTSCSIPPRASSCSATRVVASSSTEAARTATSASRTRRSRRAQRAGGLAAAAGKRARRRRPPDGRRRSGGSWRSMSRSSRGCRRFGLWLRPVRLVSCSSRRTTRTRRPAGASEAEAEAEDWTAPRPPPTPRRAHSRTWRVRRATCSSRERTWSVRTSTSAWRRSNARNRWRTTRPTRADTAPSAGVSTSRSRSTSATWCSIPPRRPSQWRRRPRRRVRSRSECTGAAASPVCWVTAGPPSRAPVWWAAPAAAGSRRTRRPPRRGRRAARERRRQAPRTRVRRRTAAAYLRWPPDWRTRSPRSSRRPTTNSRSNSTATGAQCCARRRGSSSWASSSYIRVPAFGAR